MKSQIIIFDQSRSASNLLVRMLSKQSTLEYLSHPFSAARGTQVQWLLQKERYSEGMPEDLRAVFDEKIKDGVKRWRQELMKAHDNHRHIMIHDHPFAAVSPEQVLETISKLSNGGTSPEINNFTLVPDSLLLRAGAVVILTIRHPVLAVSSAYRVLRDMGLPNGSGRPNFLISTTPLWNRMFYDFLVLKGMSPVIVDADDVMTSEDFVRGLCKGLELDPEACIFSWPPLSESEKSSLHPMEYASQRTLLNSSGVIPDKAATHTDLEAEMELWKEEFGDDEVLVREMVELATPHYEYLFQRRFTGTD